MNSETKEKVYLVTGANSGIGKATALGLARRGAKVVMVCRDRGRGEVAREEISKRSGNELVNLLIADLSSQRAIWQLAKEFKSKYHRLDVLVNNASVIHGTRRVTEDGLEATFAVNHLAHFLLTNLLLDILKATAPSRIVNVSSTAHRRGTIDFEDLQGEIKYSGIRAYRQSKLANVLFTYELAKLLEGSGVTVNCMHPGITVTSIGKDVSRVMRLLLRLIKPLLISPEEGAETVVYLSSSLSLEGITGKYFAKKTLVTSSKQSYSREVASRLWDVSSELTNLDTLESTGELIR